MEQGKNESAGEGSPSDEHSLSLTDKAVQEGLYVSSVDALNRLSVRAADTVDQKIRAPEDRRFRILAFVWSAIGVIGISGLLYGTGLITKIQVATQIQDATQELRDELTRDLEFRRLAPLATYLEKEEGFRRDDRDVAMRLLEATAKPEYGRLRERDEFPVYFTEVLDALHAADLGGDVDRLVDLFPDVTVRYPGAFQTLVAHYGLRVAGSPLPMDSSSSTFKRFET